MTAEPILLEVADLRAGYTAGSPVITDVAFAVPAGRMISVLGPNGGGKTTLFRALLGEAPQRSGSVAIGGRIAYVPQTERYRLDFPVSALDVVLMGTYASRPWYRPLGRALRDRATAALVRVGLADRSGDRFGGLSGGQRQRVLIARALVQDAAVILLDEPLTGVDHPSAEQIGAILRELRDDGRAILVSSHDIESAREFDSVLCINGRQVYFGAPGGVTPEVLRDTYGGEIVILEEGREAIVVRHHSH